MFRAVRRLVFLASLAAMLFACGLVAQKAVLRSSVIRLHVVGASDSQEDQAVKLQVKDVITQLLADELDPQWTVEEAKNYIAGNLDVLEAAANRVLEKAGVSDRAEVSFDWEAFPKRIYDTFALPSGMYQSLRVKIGQADGRNWWCVVFPSLCMPATQQGFFDTAVGAGFSQEMADTLSGNNEIRFYLLDCLGKGEIFLWQWE